MKVKLGTVIIDIDTARHTAYIGSVECEIEYTYPLWGFCDILFHFKNAVSNKYELKAIEPYDGFECVDCCIDDWYFYIQKLTTEKMPLYRDYMKGMSTKL